MPVLITKCRDHVDWDQEQEDMAKEKVSIQMENPVPEDEQGKMGTHDMERTTDMSIMYRAILQGTSRILEQIL